MTILTDVSGGVKIQLISVMRSPTCTIRKMRSSLVARACVVASSISVRICFMTPTAKETKHAESLLQTKMPIMKTVQLDKGQVLRGHDLVALQVVSL